MTFADEIDDSWDHAAVWHVARRLRVGGHGNDVLLGGSRPRPAHRRTRPRTTADGRQAADACQAEETERCEARR